MKRLLLSLCFLSGFTICVAQLPATMEQLSATADLAKYTGVAQAVAVTDGDDRGIFYYSKEKHTVDNGVVFAGGNKGYWVRMYDKTAGVDIAWFGAKLDSTTDDGDALKRALNYPLVKITGNMAISSKTVLPEGKTIEFTEGGTFTITDTFALKFGAYIVAGDYQFLFKGTGNAVFSTNSAKYIPVCWFGARADCSGFQAGKGTDNTIPIQKAIWAATKVSDVYLPPTNASLSYRITSTLSISKKLHFFAFRFHGGGTTITYSVDDKASNIYADFSDGAAINIQGSRRVYLTDFALHGNNKEARRLASYDTINLTPEVNNPSTFLSPGIKLTYAAITTDGEKDSKLWSADIAFERLQIDNFSIGIGISQGGHVQGDRMRIENTQINQCVYGISVGQAQNRACHFFNVDMNRVWCGVTNTAFGDHTGSNFQITGGQWCNVYRCFTMQPSYTGQCVVSGLYTEAVGTIGIFGDHNPNNASILFTGCEFFMQDDGLNRGYAFLPPFYTVWAYGNLTFDGCNFWAGRHFLAMFAGSASDEYTGSTITLRGCSIHHCTSIHIKGNSNIENSYLIPYSGSIDYSRSITADFEANNRYVTGYSPALAISGMESANAAGNKMSSVRAISRKVPRFFTVQDARGQITGITFRHDTVQFSYSEVLKKSFFNYAGGYDVIGTNLTKEDVTGYDNPTLTVITNDTVNRVITAVAHTPDFKFDKIGLYTNSFFTTNPVSGIVKKGVSKITGIFNIDVIRSGDYITFDEAKRAYRISSLNAGDSSATLMDPVGEDVDGRVSIYNELLEDKTTSGKAIPTTAIRTITASEVLSPVDKTVLVGASGADITVTLPAGVAIGHEFTIKKIAEGHTVIVTPAHGAIDGKTNYIIKENYQTLQVQYDGENYFIISK